MKRIAIANLGIDELCLIRDGLEILNPDGEKEQRLRRRLLAEVEQAMGELEPAGQAA
jgi:hypothetical protein